MTAEILSRNWGWVVLRGAATILFGLLAVVAPGMTLMALILVFAIFAFAEGIAGIVAAIRSAQAQERWGMLLVSGIVSCLAGAVAATWPGMTALVLVFVIAWRAVVTGIFDIMAAIRIRHEVTGEWMLALAGALSLIFGVLLMLFPGQGALALLSVIAFWAILVGVLLVALGLKLRSWRHAPGPRLRPAGGLG